MLIPLSLWSKQVFVTRIEHMTSKNRLMQTIITSQVLQTNILKVVHSKTQEQTRKYSKFMLLESADGKLIYS